jgi:hypothetical protein
MLKRDGGIVHIDFGFFLSNAPGNKLKIKKLIYKILIWNLFYT